MQNVKRYLTEYIDDKAELRKCGHEITDSLTLFLKNAFEYYEIMIMGEKALLLKPMQRQTLYKMQNWMRQIEETCEMHTVLLLDEATPYMTKKMLMDKTAFIIPNKQINLPFLVMMVRTEKTTVHKAILKFTPATQLIFLFILYSDSEKFSIENIAAELEISKMSAQRGLTELEHIGLMSHTLGGKTGRKKVFQSINKKEFYAEGKTYLDNPVRDRVCVKRMPEIDGSVVSDLSALAEQTMLGEPLQKHYAMYSRLRDDLDEFTVSEEQATEEKLPVVQLMKYDVGKLSHNRYIDPVSMIYSLSENDERIQISVNELMEQYKWYTNEDGE